MAIGSGKERVNVTSSSCACAGVAAAMALLAQPATAKLPPLEALFTLEEEIGLNGELHEASRA